MSEFNLLPAIQMYKRIQSELDMDVRLAMMEEITLEVKDQISAMATEYFPEQESTEVAEYRAKLMLLSDPNIHVVIGSSLQEETINEHIALLQKFNIQDPAQKALPYVQHVEERVREILGNHGLI